MGAAKGSKDTTKGSKGLEDAVQGRAPTSHAVSSMTTRCFASCRFLSCIMLASSSEQDIWVFLVCFWQGGSPCKVMCVVVWRYFCRFCGVCRFCRCFVRALCCCFRYRALGDNLTIFLIYCSFKIVYFLQ